MSGKLLLKAMVLGTMTFSIYTVGIAAEVQDVNGLDSAHKQLHPIQLEKRPFGLAGWTVQMW